MDTFLHLMVLQAMLHPQSCWFNHMLTLSLINQEWLVGENKRDLFTLFVNIFTSSLERVLCMT